MFQKRRASRYTTVIPVFIIALLAGYGCIEPYSGDIDDEPELISIKDSVVKGMGRQEIVVSRTTSLMHPDFEPVAGCMVAVMDDLENEFIFEEISRGVYSKNIPDEDLVIGRNYKLIVITPGGDHYESDFEKLESGVPVDSTYYEIEQRFDPDIQEDIDGLQFYVDLRAPDSISRYFRWIITETFEYTSAGHISYYYYDASLEPVIPSDIWALYRCWLTEELDDIYLTSTVNLTRNEKKQIPLNYVSTETDRLKIMYSLLVHQYSINEDAFNYFMQNKISAEGSDGLYTQQPQQPVTNIRNLEDDTERVLGYFWLSEVSTKRIFVPRINSLDVNDHFYPIETFNMEDHGDGPFPLPIMEDPETGERMTGGTYCFDCRRRGGTTTRPEFWK